MKNLPLLPHKCKTIGWITLPITFITGCLTLFYNYELNFLDVNIPLIISDDFFDENNLTNEFALTLLIISLIFVAFSKEKEEDEFVNQLRLTSFQWAVLFNTIILFILNWTLYGGKFYAIIIYNIFSTLLFYIIRFNILHYRIKHD